MRARQQRHDAALRRNEQIRASMKASDPLWVIAARCGRSENFVRRIGGER